MASYARVLGWASRAPAVVEALLRVVDAGSQPGAWSLDAVGRSAEEEPTIGCGCLPEYVAR